jgi:hypothetical protein
MITAVQVLPAIERRAEDHSFVIPTNTSILFAGWGPRL